MNVSDRIKNTEVTMTVGELQESNFNTARDAIATFVTKLQQILLQDPETPATFGEFAALLEGSLEETEGMTVENWTEYL